jgi:D-galactarolactone cycloisomerase
VKIEAVRTHVLAAPIDAPFASSQRWDHSRSGLVVEIVGENGVTGWGEAYGPPAILARIIESTFVPQLVGEDALAIEAIWARLYDSLRDHGQRGVVIQAISAIDVGLWDLKGKTLGVSVATLLGGPVRTRIRAYATGLYRRALDRAENHRLLLDEAKGYLDRGMTAMKVKIGFGRDYDVEMVESLRQLLGPDIGLMADCNHGYDLTHARDVARRLESFDLGWLEEPVVPENLSAYARLRDATSIPIAGGESHFTRHGFLDILRLDAMEIVQPDICAAGGLTESKKIADLASAFGARCVPHVWGTGIGIAAALHLIAVLPHTATGWEKQYEPMLEYDCTPHPFRQAILRQPLEVVDGFIDVPEAPGLGIEIDVAALDAFRVRAD